MRKHHLDVVDRQTASIVDTRIAEGSTVRCYNADGLEFMTLKSDNVSTRFDSLIGEELVGVRHAKPIGCFNDDPEPCTERKERQSMTMTKYTPGLLAELAKKPNVRSLEIPVTPDGQWIASCTRRYMDERDCKTTFFDVGDVELVSISEDCDTDGARFGSVLGRNVEKVTVSSRPDGLIVSFVVSMWPEEGLDKRSVALSAGGSVEFCSEVDVVSMIEETHTTSDVITSFFEDETSDEPWLVIVEPVEHERERR